MFVCSDIRHDRRRHTGYGGNERDGTRLGEEEEEVSWDRGLMEDYITDGVLVLFPKALLSTDVGQTVLKMILGICRNLLSVWKRWEASF